MKNYLILPDLMSVGCLHNLFEICLPWSELNDIGDSLPLVELNGKILLLWTKLNVLNDLEVHLDLKQKYSTYYLA